MSDEQPKEGAGRIVLLVFAFVTMPLTVGLLSAAGYAAGRLDLLFVGMSFFAACILWIAGVVIGSIHMSLAFAARGSARFVVRRLALFTLIIVIGGSLGGCFGGCVWGYKQSRGAWPGPTELR